MTPEQIMGVQTPEQMLGLTDKSDDKYLTPEQRFMKRQQDAKLTMATNGASSFNLWHNDSNPFGQRNTGSAFSKPDQSANLDSSSTPNADSSKDFSRFLSAPEHSAFNPNQKFTGRTWGAFAAPTSDAPKADLAQEAALERFRTLIGSSSQPNNSQATTFQPPSPKIQPTSQLDMFGRPLANSSSGLKQPSSLTTLPSITGSHPLPAAPKKNWWAPQPAPWLSTGLQPNGLSDGPPARKFY